MMARAYEAEEIRRPQLIEYNVDMASLDEADMAGGLVNGEWIWRSKRRRIKTCGAAKQSHAGNGV